MLKQILQDMRVEPEILNGLTETEKQTLFCIMREEQVRRWRAWDQEQTENDKNKRNSLINSDDETYNTVQIKGNKKKSKNLSVQFLIGEDGEPWVWVMGEHENDKSIEQILAEEAHQKARELAEQEAVELRKSVDLTEIIEYQTKDHFCLDEKKSAKKLSDDEDNNTPIIDDLEIYCTVDEIRDRINTNNKLNVTPKISNRIVNSLSKFDKCNVLQEISNKPQKQIPKVAARVALWEQRLITERSNEILKGIQKKQLEKAKEAEEAARKDNELWMEQERKAKQAELKMREIARRAREEHRKSLNGGQSELEDHTSSSSTSTSPAITIPPTASFKRGVQQTSSPAESLGQRPANQEAVLKWYRETEMPKGTGFDNFAQKTPSRWFHGLLSRIEAEKLLSSKPEGYFLVRISEKIWGYAISYKDHDRCKHYLVDASSGGYQFLGSNQKSHSTLKELIDFHSATPITASGNERLRSPCSVPPGSAPNILLP